MKIDNSFNPAMLGGNAAPAPKAVAAMPAVSTQVHLSAASAHLAASGNAEGISTRRMEEIKLAISEGRFKINAEAIADNLLSSAQALLSSRRQA